MIGIPKEIVLALAAAATALGVAYLAYAVHRSKLHYDDLKSAPQYQPRLFDADDELGYAPVPSYRGALVIDRRIRVPSFHDADGFRVAGAPEKYAAQHGPSVLTLGDSYSYGFGIEARETYSQLVARALGGVARNAAANGYGLAQMLILARRHIPALEPDYVLVQYSPWLIGRALRPFAPTDYVAVPVPYFRESRGEPRLAPPLFRGIGPDLPLAEYGASDPSPGDFAAFLLRVGVPLRVHDDPRLELHRFGKLLGLVPRPEQTPARVEEHVLREIAELCRAHGSRLLVVALANWQGTTGLERSGVPDGAIAVRADRALYRRLEDGSSEAFIRDYAIFWGEHRNLHHNPAANRIVADEVLEAIARARRAGAAAAAAPGARPAGGFESTSP